MIIQEYNYLIQNLNLLMKLNLIIKIQWILLKNHQEFI